MRTKTIIMVLTSIMMMACSPQSQTPNHSNNSNISSPNEGGIQVGKDYHSYANPEEIVVKHIDLDLRADFENSLLVGSAKLAIDRANPKSNTLILDTRGLKINSVEANAKPVSYDLKPADPNLGAALHIDLPDDADSVKIDYQTSPDASGVQWLTPAQTAGKRHPFLFTQAQAVHARSFI